MKKLGSFKEIFNESILFNAFLSCVFSDSGGQIVFKGTDEEIASTINLGQLSAKYKTNVILINKVDNYIVVKYSREKKVGGVNAITSGLVVSIDLSTLDVFVGHA